MAKNDAYKKKEGGNSQFKMVWIKLRENKFAMASLFILIAVCLIAIFAPILAPYDYTAQNYEEILMFPCLKHPFGTDQFGRDILSRIIWGSRYTIVIGVLTMVVSGVIGTALGIFAAYYPKLDNPIMRFLDIFSSIPDMALLMCLVIILGTSMRNMIIALGLYYIPGYARLARSKVLTLRNEEYVEASIALGASDGRILMTHILPNSLAPIIVRFTMSTGGCILEAASLSYIGLGIQPPEPEWGLMISQGKGFLSTNWYYSIIPGLCIVLVSYCLNYLGDGLRDALDPRLNY